MVAKKVYSSNTMCIRYADKHIKIDTKWAKTILGPTCSRKKLFQCHEKVDVVEIAVCFAPHF